MMKRISSLTVMLAIAVIQLLGQDVLPTVVVSQEALDYGELVLGYPRSQTFTVHGSNLMNDVTLTVDGDRHGYQYQVAPATITPQEAASGVSLTVKLVPMFVGACNANLVLSSPGMQDVVIPMTAQVNNINATIIGSTSLALYAAVGSMAATTEVLRWADVEIPPDPNTPVVRRGGGETLMALPDNAGIANYNISITGAKCFSYMIVKSSDLVKTCTLRIIYRPTDDGPHYATLRAECAGAAPINIQLEGKPAAGISDVSSLIDLLIEDESLPAAADVNDDGKVSISDVSCLIDRLLGK